MVDRIRKVLGRLSSRQRDQLLDIILLIKEDRLTGLDVKKLQARTDIYRVRKGSFRVIFRTMPGAENVIIAVERRSDTTYNAF